MAHAIHKRITPTLARLASTSTSSLTPPPASLTRRRWNDEQPAHYFYEQVNNKWFVTLLKGSPCQVSDDVKPWITRRSSQATSAAIAHVVQVPSISSGHEPGHLLFSHSADPLIALYKATTSTLGTTSTVSLRRPRRDPAAYAILSHISHPQTTSSDPVAAASEPAPPKSSATSSLKPHFFSRRAVLLSGITPHLTRHQLELSLSEHEGFDLVGSGWTNEARREAGIVWPGWDFDIVAPLNRSGMDGNWCRHVVYLSTEAEAASLVRMVHQTNPSWNLGSNYEGRPSSRPGHLVLAQILC